MPNWELRLQMVNDLIKGWLLTPEPIEEQRELFKKERIALIKINLNKKLKAYSKVKKVMKNPPRYDKEYFDGVEYLDMIAFEDDTSK